MRFILVSSKRFPLKVQGNSNRFWHLATIHYGVREYMYFVDTLTLKTYIEEITGGHLETIEDDSLWQELANFIQSKGITYINKRR